LSYQLLVLGSNTTAVQMAAPVRKILDQPMYILPLFLCFIDLHIIIIINCNWAVARWHWLFHV